MTKSEILTLCNKGRERKQKSTDLDVLVVEILKLPPGQLKKVLTEPVLEVLKKYGYTEESA